VVGDDDLVLEMLTQLRAVGESDVFDVGQSPIPLLEAWPGASTRMVITANRRKH